MAKSKGSFPRRATVVDDLTRPDHSYLDENDDCIFIGEYTARAGYQHSETNQLIHNLKKGMDRRERYEWRYKEQAIQQAAATFREVLSSKALTECTFVPIPPSKARSDAAFDDRMVQVVNAIRPHGRIDARELLLQTRSTPAAHEGAQRPTPEEIATFYRINEDVAEPVPAKLVVIDDMLTTGAHFKAAKSVLVARFPGVRVFGLFVARRAIPETDFTSDFD